MTPENEKLILETLQGIAGQFTTHDHSVILGALVTAEMVLRKKGNERQRARQNASQVFRNLQSVRRVMGLYRRQTVFDVSRITENANVDRK